MAAPRALSMEEEIKEAKKKVEAAENKVEAAENELKQLEEGRSKEEYTKDPEYLSAKEDLARKEVNLAGAQQILAELLKKENLLSSQGGAGVGPGSLEVIITFTVKGKQLGSVFSGVPSLQDVRARVETLFDQFQREDFTLFHNKIMFNEEATWSPWIARRTSGATVQVESASKAFLLFKSEEVSRLLNLASMPKEDDAMFREADLPADKELPPHLQAALSLTTVGELINHTGRDLALRFVESDVAEAGKEMAHRELISPLLFTSCALVGGVRLLAEHNIKGTNAHGSLDWAIVFRHFSVVVIEAKLHDKLEDHIGQLAAEMKSARDVYKLSVLGKRKNDDEGDALLQVPSFGILSNGLVYKFFRYDANNKELVHSRRFNLLLEQGTNAASAGDFALPVIKRLVFLIQQQVDAVRSLPIPKKAKP